MKVVAEINLGQRHGNFVVSSDPEIGNYAIITDATWWINTVDEIDQWLDDTGIAPHYRHEGMVLTFSNEEDLALFVLRWSS